MKVGTLKIKGAETAHVLVGGRLYPVADVAIAAGRDWPSDVWGLLQSGKWFDLLGWFCGGGESGLATGSMAGIPLENAPFAPPYRHPRKIWGIGLNYREHAADLDEKSPTAEPASFMKPDTSIIGPEEEILVPAMSEKTTGEAELGLVFGRTCRDVPQADWQEALAGYTTIIDMTAEDILRRNPRNLTQSKSFDTFFSFGPLLYSVDEVADVRKLRVRTVHNGRTHAENTVDRMTFPPDFLVSYHSRIMTMLPGDIISSGTPGAAHLAEGDRVECHIDGFAILGNPVRDLKVRPLQSPDGGG